MPIKHHYYTKNLVKYWATRYGPCNCMGQ